MHFCFIILHNALLTEWFNSENNKFSCKLKTWNCIAVSRVQFFSNFIILILLQSNMTHYYNLVKYIGSLCDERVNFIYFNIIKFINNLHCIRYDMRWIRMYMRAYSLQLRKHLFRIEHILLFTDTITYDICFVLPDPSSYSKAAWTPQHSPQNQGE